MFEGQASCSSGVVQFELPGHAGHADERPIVEASNVPEAHDAHTEAPVAPWYVPGWHSACRPPAAQKLPTGHEAHAVAEAPFVAARKVPSPQAVGVVAPAAHQLPATQGPQSPSELPPVPVRSVPAGQGVGVDDSAGQ